MGSECWGNLPSMRTIEDLRTIAAAGESESVEFKKTTGLRKEAAQTACAMLNGRGGSVFFGIGPAGELVGQQVGAQTIEDISKAIEDIDPPPSRLGITTTPIGPDRAVIEVRVDARGPLAPYSIKGRAYARVGNTTVELSRENYNRMLLERLHAEERWENTVADGWNLDDLDQSEIVRCVEDGIRRGRIDDPGTRETGELLRGLGLLRSDRPIRAAAVLFGRSGRVEERLAQCLLRVARFRGVDKSEFLDSRMYHGNAFRLLRLGERFLRESLPIAARILPGVFERLDDPLYPLEALREALVNAICHRDYAIGGGSIALAIYDDRLEVTSSGTLHFGLTPEALFEHHESLPWNPIIARAFQRRGLFENWGRGTIQMARAMERAGLPRPEFEESGGCLIVRFRSRPPAQVRTSAVLSDRQARILAALRGSPLALRYLKDLVPGAEWELKQDLATLKGLGLVDTHGHGRGAYWEIRPR